MKAKMKNRIIKCPICQNEDFYVKEGVSIRAIVRDDFEDKLYNICKDELECRECGWTGYFSNERDPEENWEKDKIIYEY